MNLSWFVGYARNDTKVNDNVQMCLLIQSSDDGYP